MPSRGRKRQSEPAAPSHTLEQNGHTLTVVNHRLRGGSQKDGALQGGSQMESDKDGGSPRESSGNSKRKAPDPPSKSAKEFRWAPPLPLNLSSVPRGGKPSLMGVGSFAGVAAPLQNSGPPMPVLESPHSQGMLLSPRGGVAGDIFAGGGSESTGARAPLGSDKLPPKSPVLQALSNGQIMPQAPSLSGGSKGSALGGSGFLHPSMQGQVLQQPKMEFAHPPSPKPAASNQELLQRMQMLQQQNKRQEAAQQHFIALQQKIQQQQLQQQKILQSLQTPPNSKPANPAAAMLSASLLNPPRNDANIDSHGGPNANPLANPSLTRSRSSNSHTTGGGPPQPNSVPLYISQADKLPPRNAGSCVRRLMQYMYHQRKRSADNSIEFWREFVSEYFAPGAKKRWCVSCYSHNGRSPAGVFPQEVWHCELCGADPGRGFETTREVLPRLFQVKYDSGVQEELLYVDIPNEYMLASGVHVLEYNRVVQESVFEQLRVVRQGQLRIVFSTDVKILSWEFCAHGHEEYVPRRALLSQAAELAFLRAKLQGEVRTAEDLQAHCNALAAVTKQLALNLEQPTVNDLGFTKRYVRCLQISEVVDNMKDLISFNRETGLGPIASLRAYAAQHESARPGALQGLRQTSAEGGEHSPPFREEARPTQSQSFSAGEPDPETAFQQYVQQKLGRSALPEGPVALRTPLGNVGGLQLTPSTGLLTGPESISGGGLLDQFSAASILRGPAKHGFELPTTSGGEFRGASGGGAEFRAPELNGLSSMSQMQALLMGDGDEDELDVAALGVSELPSPGALDDFMFRLPG